MISISSFFDKFCKRASILIAVAGLLFIVGSHKVFAANQGTWSVSSSGVVSGISAATYSGNFETAFLTSTTTPANITAGRCYGSGGGSGSGPLDTSGYNGLNVFANGGLGTTGCTAAGNYYFTVTNSGHTILEDYWVVYFDGVNVTPVNPPPPNLQTRFISIYPENATTTPSNTVTISWNIYRGDDLPDFYDHVCYDIQSSQFQGDFLPRSYCQLEAISGSASFSTTTTLSSGKYQGFYYFYDVADNLHAISTTTDFTVVHDAGSNLTDILTSLGASTTASTTFDTSSCNPLGGIFASTTPFNASTCFLLCLLSLLILHPIFLTLCNRLLRLFGL